MESNGIYANIRHRFKTGDIMNSAPIKEDPVERFRKLLRSLSPTSRLPKKQEDEEKEAAPKQDAPNPNTASKPSASASKPKPTPDSASKSSSSIFGPRLWTIASVLSLTGNIILVLVLIALLVGINRMGLSTSYLLGLGNSLLSLPEGLYANFEKMDRASITTEVVVNTTIPVQFDLQLNQQTDVVLSQDVTITNALVTVNTGGLNISRANTTIVLPQGTTLPVFLNLVVPLDTQIPVTLNVPVNIPLSQTELNEPFVGLQGVIKPLYCALNRNAVNMDGQPICP